MPARSVGAGIGRLSTANIAPNTMPTTKDEIIIVIQ